MCIDSGFLQRARAFKFNKKKNLTALGRERSTSSVMVGVLNATCIRTDRWLGERTVERFGINFMWCGLRLSYCIIIHDLACDTNVGGLT